MRRYEYVGESSRKFWEIEEPRQEGDHEWIVRVKFGRLGTSGQTHTKVFSYESGAIRYRNAKIDEKLGKGYILKSAPKPKPQTFQQASAAWFLPPQKPAKAVCLHNTINRTGNKYKCASCGEQVEFDKPQVEVEKPEFQQRVRRFFAGASA